MWLSFLGGEGRLLKLMKVVLLLLLLVTLVPLPATVDAIVRSELSAPQPPSELFPFAVSLQLLRDRGPGEHFCGGTYLGNGWILTAAHCVIPFNYTQIVAQIGGHDLNDDDASTIERYPIEEVQILRTYNPVTMVGDIALLRAAIPREKLRLSRLRRKDSKGSLLLPARHEGTLVNGELCYIFGYGSESYDGPISRRLRYGTVLALELDSCIGMMGAVVAPPPDSGMFCAIGQADACKGDSGGGYVCRKPPSTQFVLRGIISYGVGCGAAGTPGVYTDVAYYLHHYPLDSLTDF